jgi:hypothetical protein
MTINELLTAYDKSLTTELEGQVFTLTGTLTSNDRKPWGRQLYWHVVAEGARLKVCIDRDDSRFSGQQVEVTGQLSRELRRWSGDFELLLTVTRMTPLGTSTEDWMGPFRAIGTRRQGEWPSIERAIEDRIRAGDHPRVLLILGTGTRIEGDIRRGLGAYDTAYNLIEQRVAMDKPRAIAERVF